MQDYSLNAVIRVLYNWRKPLLAVVAGAAVLSTVVALLLPNYYQATTIFYAASQDLFKPQKVFGYSQTDMYYYGGTEDIQRVLTAATSQPVLDHLIDEFDLYDHYHIKKEDPRAEFKVRKKLLYNYTITRTKYDALELSVEDKDPALTAKMANSARDKINEVLTGIIRNSQRDLVTSYGGAITAKKLALNAIEDSLQKFQSIYSIYDPSAQAEFLATLMTNVETRLARDRGALKTYQANKTTWPGVRDSIMNLTADIAGLEMQRDLLSGSDTTVHNSYNMDRFSQGKGKVEFYEDAYQKAVSTLNTDQEMLKQMQAALALDVTALHLVEGASTPVVKSWPKRSILVLASTLIVFVFAIFGILLIESLKREDWSFLKW